MPRIKANPEEIEPVIAGDGVSGRSHSAAHVSDALRSSLWSARPWLVSLVALALCSFAFLLGWAAHSVSIGGGGVGTSSVAPPFVIGAPHSRSLLTSDAVAWRLTNRNHSINVAAVVPGVAHEALLAAKVAAPSTRGTRMPLP